MLYSKCELYGVRLELVNPLSAATQTCFNCDNRLTGSNKLSLKDSKYICPICGYIEDRDINAAKNILKFAQRLLAGAQSV